MPAELLAQIYASPEDDALRQVYGDWLIEQDDPRGEFIALQFKQARGVATAEDDRRVAALALEHWWLWAGKLAGAIHRPEIEFEKGFLSRVTLGKVSASTSQQLLDQIVGDATWGTVRHVKASQTIGSYPATVIHPVMKGLRSLVLDFGSLPRVCGGPVPWSLERLELRSWIVEDEQLKVIAECPGFARLEHLVLATGGSSDEVMRRVLRARICERLQRLTLAFTGHGADMEPVVEALSGDSAIEVLEIELNAFACCAALAPTGGRYLAVTLREATDHAIAVVSMFLDAARGRFASVSLAHGANVVPTWASKKLVRSVTRASEVIVRPTV